MSCSVVHVLPAETMLYLPQRGGPADPAPPPAAVEALEGEDPERTPPPADCRSPAAASPAVAAAAAGGKGGARVRGGAGKSTKG